ncbi:MAG: TonB-dependent receptor plug domain-containing protein, partial [Chitinophagales bacterium]
MKRLLLFAVFAAVGVLCYAQNEIKGKIKESNSGQPIEGSSVYIPDLKIGAVSDSSGFFSIKKIPQGTYLVDVSVVGYAAKSYQITVKGILTLTFELSVHGVELEDVIVTGVSSAMDYKKYPMSVSVMSNKDILRNSSTNVIDAVAKVPGVSAMTIGQSISKPVIRGLGYNRVLTVNDGVQQVDQVWFDEFGIEADPDAVSRYEILKGPASLAYGSDAIAGVINLIPEKTIPEGQTKGDILFNYQTNNGLINNMVHLAGTKNGIAWSARVDNIMAHAYKNPNDGYVLNSQFSNFNTDATIGLHRKWGYTQLHSGYFELRPGIVDGTRDSLTGIMERQVSYPDLNGGDPSYEIPTHQEQKSYTPFVIDQ